MAHVIGRPGYHALRLTVIGVALLGAMPLVGLVAVWVGAIAHSWMPVGVTVGMAIGMYLRRADYRELLEFIRTHLRGGEGESRTATVLDALSDDHVVFHGFTFATPDGSNERWDIDHVVVGPTGVFALETKNPSSSHMGPAESDWRVKKHVKQVSRNATTLRERLGVWSGGKLADVWVEAIVVYVQDDASVANLKEGTTQVLPLKLLARAIHGRMGRELNPGGVFDAARAIFSQYPEEDRAVFRPAMESLERQFAEWRRREDPSMRTR